MIHIIRHTRIHRVKTTAYCCCEICCENFSDGLTSTMRDARKTVGVAIDPKVFSYGDKFFIRGIGIRIADDTGGAMRQSTKKGVKHIDIRMASHKLAREYGVKEKYVIVFKKG